MKHKMNPVMDAQLNRNRQRQRGHRRNLSDGRISSATEHLGEDVSTRMRADTFLDLISFFFQIGGYSSLPGRPYSSMSGGFTGGLDPLATDPLGLDNSQSYLGEGSSMLRDSGYGGNDSDDSNRARFLASHRFVCAVCVECSRVLSSHLTNPTCSESIPSLKVTTESKTGLSNFLPSHRLVGEALI